MKDQVEQLIERRLTENLLSHDEDLLPTPSHKPFLPLDEWLKLKAAGERHRLNATKRKLQKLRN